VICREHRDVVVLADHAVEICEKRLQVPVELQQMVVR
jgi:hypothetical protein